MIKCILSTNVIMYLKVDEKYTRFIKINYLFKIKAIVNW